MRSDGHDGTGYRRWLARTVGGFRDDGFDADVAADLAGEVVLRLLQAEQAGRHITAPYWRCVMRSVKNDYLRRLSVTRATNERIIARINAEPAEDPEQRAVLHLWYEECLASLGADEAQIVRMHLEEQYTFEVISQRMNCHTDRVRKSYGRPIAKLPFARLGLMLLAKVAIDIAVVLFPIRAYAFIPNNCEVACKDVNDCGCIPFYSSRSWTYSLAGGN